MAKTIKFNYKDNEYTLEFSRATIEAMEKQGFNISEYESKPMTTMHRMFVGSFKMHHPSLSNARIEEIFDKMCDVQELFENLVDMYKEAIETLNVDETLGEIKWEMK